MNTRINVFYGEKRFTTFKSWSDDERQKGKSQCQVTWSNEGKRKIEIRETNQTSQGREKNILLGLVWSVSHSFSQPRSVMQLDIGLAPFWAAARRGRCPINWGEFPFIHPYICHPIKGCWKSFRGSGLGLFQRKDLGGARKYIYACVHV